ncbi:MAG: very short patch repair endonuclease [Bacteroidota bacterium]|nr:very short patch repair endonuclease [Bacteroidota bacterium]
MDKHSKSQRSKNMQAVKSSGSKIEQLLGKAMWAKGLRYRKNYKKVFGKPDFVFIGKKVAVFCDSEFFHGKHWETKKHKIKSNQSFWYKKIERNIERDIEVNTFLIKNNWTVIRFWGKEIRHNPKTCAEIVEANLKKK